MCGKNSPSTLNPKADMAFRSNEKRGTRDSGKFCQRTLDTLKLPNWRHSAVETSILLSGLSEDEFKALSMLVNISKEKANTNAQSDWTFKLDKRTQYSAADAWVASNLGKYLNLDGHPVEKLRFGSFWRRCQSLDCVW